MRDIHYFQRFSKKEDVVTNNTLLLLSRLQHHDFRLLEEILQQLPSLEDVSVGASITQQESSPSGRIADGLLRQRSFHVAVETKLGASFNLDQLTGHLSRFDTTPAEVEALLLLAPTVPVDLSGAAARVRAFNEKTGRAVRLTWSTFANLIEKVREVIPEHERILLELLDDYEAFCGEEELLSDTDAELLVVGCSKSLSENVELRLYYDPKRPSRTARYIGFYSDKAVRSIGTLSKVSRVDRVGTQLQVVEGPPLSAEELARVDKAMSSAAKYGWKIDVGYYFFIADDVQPTEFRKQTKYPLWSWRYINLRTVLDTPKLAPLPQLDELAEKLGNEFWS